jgi:glutaredoxin 3
LKTKALHIRKPMPLARSDGSTAVPQIFIGGVHVGGCDDLIALDNAGKLDPMLAGNTA